MRHRSQYYTSYIMYTYSYGLITWYHTFHVDNGRLLHQLRSHTPCFRARVMDVHFIYFVKRKPLFDTLRDDFYLHRYITITNSYPGYVHREKKQRQTDTQCNYFYFCYADSIILCNGIATVLPHYSAVLFYITFIFFIFSLSHI
jgi:hypothetical protein